MSVKSRAGKKAKRKGEAFERQIAIDLRAWLGEGWDVRRTRTVDQARTDHAGEYVIQHEALRFPFAIECKAHATLTTWHLWQPTAQLVSWWSQACVQADGCARLPLLLVKVPRRGVLAIVRAATASKLEWTGLRPCHRFWLDDGVPGGDHLVAVRWDDVLAMDAGCLQEVT